MSAVKDRRFEVKTAERVIAKMLTENTGTHMLDSGGAYGRNWQRNTGKKIGDFRREKSVTWDKATGYTINLFHYLAKDLRIDPVCESFNKCFVPAKDWDGGELEEVYGVSKAGVEWLKEKGFQFKRTFNSYNGDSALSQVIQGTWLEWPDSPYSGDRGYYLLLQIHGGCDVRGGYTDARLFYVPGYADGALLEDVYGTITRKSGRQIRVSNLYDGVTLGDEDTGAAIEMHDDDDVELYLM